MTIRSLRFALTLAEELHFGNAARRSFITPQAFGRVIQDLEVGVGFEIFTRTSRRVEVSGPGRPFLTRARAVVDAFDALMSDQPVAHENERLVFAVLGFGIGRLWDILGDALSSTRPVLEPAFADVTFSEQYNVVRSGRADVGFVMDTGPVEGLDILPVTAVDVVAVVPKRSDYAAAERLYTSDIADETFVAVDGDLSIVGGWIGDAPTKNDLDRVQYPGALPAAVAMTNRVALHGVTAAEYFPHPDVAFIPLHGRTCGIAIAVRSGDHRPFIDVIRNLAPRLTELSAITGGRS